MTKTKATVFHDSLVTSISRAEVRTALRVRLSDQSGIDQPRRLVCGCVAIPRNPHDDQTLKEALAPVQFIAGNLEHVFVDEEGSVVMEAPEILRGMLTSCIASLLLFASGAPVMPRLPKSFCVMNQNEM